MKTRKIRSKKRNVIKVNSKQEVENSNCPSLEELTSDIDINIKFLKEHLKNCSDIVFRYLEIEKQDAWLIYTNGLVDDNLLTEGVLKVLLEQTDFSEISFRAEVIRKNLPMGQVSITTETKEIMDRILTGHLILLIKNEAKAIVINLQKLEGRGIEPSMIEPSTKGPKESFIESLDTNITLIRRRIPHPDFKIINFTIGKYSKTNVAVMYVSSIANEKLVKEALRRLKKIDTDSIASSNYLEEALDDNPYSIFPTVLETDRPDKVASALLEGRIALLQNNNPFALIAPTFFISFFQAADDYYRSFIIGTLLRYSRYISAFISIFLPGIYVAFTTFNQEMIPTPLLITLANQRAGIPFPVVIEAISMGAAFEILKEAGTRLPKPIGQAVSIVGALVIGDAAVNAGIVSPAMVIVTALTAISSFTIPSQELETPLLVLRLLITMVSGFLGFWGILIITILILGHITSLRSLDIPYTSPLAPLNIADLDDILVRAPLRLNQKRPISLNKKNLKR